MASHPAFIANSNIPGIMRLLYCFLLISILLLGCSGSNIVVARAEYAEKTIITSLAHPVSLRALHAAVVSDTPAVASHCSCKKLKVLFRQASSSLDIFYGLKSWEVCKCPGQPHISENRSRIINEGAQSSKLVEFCGASLTGFVLDSSDKTQMDVSTLHKKLSMLSLPDGTFASSFASKYSGVDASVFNTEVVLLLLNTFNRGVPDTVHANMVKLLHAPVGNTPSRSLSGAHLYAPQLLGAIATAGDSLPVLSVASIKAISTGAADLLYSEDVVTVSMALRTLHVVATLFKHTQPVFIRREDPLERGSSSDMLMFSARNVLGKTMKLRASAKAVLSLRSVGEESAELFPVMRMNISDNRLLLDLAVATAVPLPVGRYEANVALQTLGRNGTITHVESLVRSVNASLTGIKFGLAVSSGKKKKKKAAEPRWLRVLKEGDLSSERLVVDVRGGDSTAHIEFRVRRSDLGDCTTYQQAVVCLTHIETQRVLHYHAVTNFSKSGGKHICRYSVDLALHDDMAYFHHNNGSYALKVLVGDALLNSAQKFYLGDVDILFPRKRDQILPIYQQSLLHASNIALSPLPEMDPIPHQPVVRASESLYQAFSIIACFPLLLLCWYYNRHGVVTISTLERGNIFKGLFMFCILVIVAIFPMYWLQVPCFSFFESLRILV